MDKKINNNVAYLEIYCIFARSEFAQAPASCPMIVWWQLTDRLWQAALQQGRLQEKRRGCVPLFSFPFP